MTDSWQIYVYVHAHLFELLLFMMLIWWWNTLDTKLVTRRHKKMVNGWQETDSGCPRCYTNKVNKQW